jgi:hypothetical protein
MKKLVQPKAIEAASQFDYAIRAAAHQLLDAALVADAKPGYYDMVLDDVLAHSRSREILSCMAQLATSSYLEYYYSDREWAASTIEREWDVAEDLANAEARLFGQRNPPQGGNMKVRMRINVEGGFHNIHDGVKRGDVVSIENDETALRYCQHGYCQTDLKGELGAPFHPAA